MDWLFKRRYEWWENRHGAKRDGHNLCLCFYIKSLVIWWVIVININIQWQLTHVYRDIDVRFLPYALMDRAIFDDGGDGSGGGEPSGCMAIIHSITQMANNCSVTYYSCHYYYYYYQCTLVHIKTKSTLLPLMLWCCDAVSPFPILWIKFSSTILAQDVSTGHKGLWIK